MRLTRLIATTSSAFLLSAGLGQIASAADMMPVTAPRAPVPIYYNGSGFYVGANGGYGWGTSKWIDDPGFGGSDLGSHRTRGATVGGQIGYNWQTGNWVFGFEGDVNWANLKGSHTDQF